MLRGKTALITGSTSGIGQGIAEALARAGANIILNGFGETANIESLRRGLEAASGSKAIHSSANMTDPAEIQELAELAERSFGGVDILVNNAGVQHVAPIDEFPIDKWNTIIALNLSSAFHTVRLCLPAMKRKKWGRIINIASAHGQVASPYKVAYVAAKHGIIGLTKTVALEVAQMGITVNAISPAYVWTPLVEKQIPDTAKARGISEQEVIDDVLLAAQPTKRFVKIEEVAALAVFLCSDNAASITGAQLAMDGGWTAQ